MRLACKKGGCLCFAHVLVIATGNWHIVVAQAKPGKDVLPSNAGSKLGINGLHHVQIGL